MSVRVLGLEGIFTLCSVLVSILFFQFLNLSSRGRQADREMNGHTQAGTHTLSRAHTHMYAHHPDFFSKFQDPRFLVCSFPYYQVITSK